MKTVLKNGKQVVEGNRLEQVDVVIEDGLIVEIGPDLTGEEVMDLGGRLLTPGLVDIHVHFREPGFTAKETIATGSRAAARGGFTTVCAMPNTNPVPDTMEKFADLQQRIKQDACITIHHYAPITESLRSDKLVDMEKINAFAYTNDGVGVQTAGVMYEAMMQATRLDKPIVAHTEDDSLLYGGVMHEGIKNKELGLPGIMGIAESTQIARDILLAKETGVHYHVCHVSSKESVSAIREGKRQGVHVTAEVAPHHLILNEMDIPGDDAAYKMNPPLRGKEDQQALLEGLLDGTLDFIATDHAPHTQAEKSQGFIGSPFGIVGIETSFALMYTHFVKTGIITLEFLLERMSRIPAELFQLQTSSLTVGSSADLAVFDLDEPYIIKEQDYLSKSSNTPFNNTKVYGMCFLTFHKGEIVWSQS